MITAQWKYPCTNDIIIFWQCGRNLHWVKPVDSYSLLNATLHKSSNICSCIQKLTPETCYYHTRDRKDRVSSSTNKILILLKITPKLHSFKIYNFFLKLNFEIWKIFFQRLAWDLLCPTFSEVFQNSPFISKTTLHRID